MANGDYTIGGITADLSVDPSGWMQGIRQASTAVKQFERTASADMRRLQQTVAKSSQFMRRSLEVAFGVQIQTSVQGLTNKIIQFGRESVFNAARAQQMDGVLRLIGQTAGWSATQIQKQVDGIRAMGIEYGVAQDTLVSFIRYNLDVSKATDLARVAQDAAVISNSNSTATLQRLIWGIQTQNSLILRNAGLQVMAGQAMERYAAKLGKAQDQLNSTERTQAVLNAVLEEGVKINGAYERSMEEPMKRLGSMDRLVDDVQGNIGDGLYPAFKVLINDGLYPFWKWLAKATEEGTRFRETFDRMGYALANWTSGLIGWIQDNQTSLGDLGSAFVGIGEALIDIAQSFSWVKDVLIDTGALVSAMEALAAALKAIADILKALGPAVSVFVTMRLALVAYLKATALATAATTAHANSMFAASQAATIYTIKTHAATGAVSKFAASQKYSMLGLMKAHPVITGVAVAVGAAATAWLMYSRRESAVEAFNRKVEDSFHELVDLLKDLSDGVEDFEEAIFNAFSNTSFYRKHKDALDQIYASTGVSIREQIKLIRSGDFQAAMEDLAGVTGATFASPAEKMKNYWKPLTEALGINGDMWEELKGAAEVEAKAYSRVIAMELQQAFRDESANNKTKFAAYQAIKDVMGEAFLKVVREGAKYEGVSPLEYIADMAGSGRLDTPEMDAIMARYGELKISLNETTDAAEEFNAEMSRSEKIMSLLGDELSEVANALDEASLGMEAARKEIELTSGLQRELITSQQRWVEVTTSANATMDELVGSGRNAEQMYHDMVDVVGNVFDSSLDMAQALYEVTAATGDQAEAEAAWLGSMQRSRDGLAQSMRDLGIAESEIARYIDMIFQIPTTWMTSIGVDISGAIAGFRSFADFVGALYGAGAYANDELGQWAAASAFGMLDPATQEFVRRVANYRGLSYFSPANTYGPTYAGGYRPGRGGGGGGGGGADDLLNLAEAYKAAGLEAYYAEREALQMAMGVEGAKRNIVRAQMTINDLLERRNELSEYATRLTHREWQTLIGQRIAIKQAEFEIEDIRERINDLTDDEVRKQEQLVAKLREGTVELTAQEQIKVRSAMRELQLTRRLRLAGLADALDVAAAEEKLAEARAGSRGDRLEAAEAKLKQMRRDQVLLPLQLAYAEQELLALRDEQVTKADLLSDRQKELQRINLDLADAQDSLTQATWAYDDALISVGQSLKAIQDAGLGDYWTEAITRFPGFSRLGPLLTHLDLVGGVETDVGQAILQRYYDTGLLPGETGTGTGPIQQTDVTVTINTGVGDPVAIGNELVKVLQEYEYATGPLQITVA